MLVNTAFEWGKSFGQGSCVGNTTRTVMFESPKQAALPTRQAVLVEVLKLQLISKTYIYQFTSSYSDWTGSGTISNNLLPF